MGKTHTIWRCGILLGLVCLTTPSWSDEQPPPAENPNDSCLGTTFVGGTHYRTVCDTDAGLLTPDPDAPAPILHVTFDTFLVKDETGNHALHVSCGEIVRLCKNACIGDKACQNTCEGQLETCPTPMRDPADPSNFVLSFDGNDHFDIPLQLASTSEVTIAFDYRYVGEALADDQTLTLLASTDGTSLTLLGGAGKGATGTLATDTQTIPLPLLSVTGNWQRVVLTSRSGETRLYQCDQEVLVSDTAFAALTLTDLRMGASSAGSNAFSGQTDNLVIFHQALSAAEANGFCRHGLTPTFVQSYDAKIADHPWETLAWTTPQRFGPHYREVSGYDHVANIDNILAYFSFEEPDESQSAHGRFCDASKFAGAKDPCAHCDTKNTVECYAASSPRWLQDNTGAAVLDDEGKPIRDKRHVDMGMRSLYGHGMGRIAWDQWAITNIFVEQGTDGQPTPPRYSGEGNMARYVPSGTLSMSWYLKPTNYYNGVSRQILGPHNTWPLYFGVRVHEKKLCAAVRNMKRDIDGNVVTNAAGKPLATVQYFCGDQEFSLHQWHHMAVIYDSNARTFDIYLNGQANTVTSFIADVIHTSVDELSTQSSMTPTGPVLHPDLELRLVDMYMNHQGILDELMFVDGRLSEAQITHLANARGAVTTDVCISNTRNDDQTLLTPACQTYSEMLHDGNGPPAFTLSEAVQGQYADVTLQLHGPLPRVSSVALGPLPAPADDEAGTNDGVIGGAGSATTDGGTTAEAATGGSTGTDTGGTTGDDPPPGPSASEGFVPDATLNPAAPMAPTWKAAFVIGSEVVVTIDAPDAETTELHQSSSATCLPRTLLGTFALEGTSLTYATANINNSSYIAAVAQKDGLFSISSCQQVHALLNATPESNGDAHTDQETGVVSILPITTPAVLPPTLDDGQAKESANPNIPGEAGVEPQVFSGPGSSPPESSSSLGCTLIIQ